MEEARGRCSVISYNCNYFIYRDSNVAIGVPLPEIFQPVTPLQPENPESRELV